mmetsp:Transcript_5212/g.6530  ORF Transcript_5212/g.6530 Transcript_5212/m.6530 type:complete len:89 (+) Transcript_5212:459-725(+)
MCGLLCDPHRIEVLSGLRKTNDGKDDPCLIYSIGDDGDHSFEHGIMDLFGEDTCEIHTFEEKSASGRTYHEGTDEQKLKTEKIHLHYN